MTAHNGPSGSFAAPEGVYTSAAITLPLAELPVSGNVPPAIVSAPTGLSNSHDTVGIGGIAHSGGPGASNGIAVVTASTSSGTGGPAGTSSIPASSGGTVVSTAIAPLATIPPSNVLPALLLPASWRRELGCIVEPSLSSCSIRWGVSNSSNSDFAGALSAGVGVVGGRKHKDKGADVGGAGSADVSGLGASTPTVTAARRLRKGSTLTHGTTSSKPRSTLSAYNGPNPLIEGVMVSQGIDAPASSTTGGVGGTLGMSALTSYGFLPNPNGRNLFDLTSVLDIRGEVSSTSLSPTSTFKQAKNVPKPKNNMRQSNSSFVIRIWVHPELKDILSSLERAYISHNGGLDTEEDQADAEAQRSHYHQPPFYVTQRGRTLVWFLPHLPSSIANVSSSSAASSQDQQPIALVRVLFASPPSSHDINQLTRSPATLDVIVGFPTGDLLWLDLISLRYSRFNKGGCCTDSGVTKVRWLPSLSQPSGPGPLGTVVGPNGAAAGGGGAGGGEGLFLSAHVDGTMLVWDREREDSEMGKGWAPRPWRLRSDSTRRRPSVGSAVEWDPNRSIIVSRPGLVSQVGPQVTTDEGERSGETTNSTSTGGLHNGAGESFSTLDATTTAQSMPTPTSLRAGDSNPLSPRREEIPSGGVHEEHSTAHGRSVTHQVAKWDRNPVTHWKVSKSKINDFAISPDLGCIAVVSEDSLLRIIDLSTEALIASHSSYFGSFLSLAFSPDGRYLLTTSCDDLVSLYQPRPTTTQGVSQPTASRLLARCVGHSSWVRGVAFDPYRWREGDRTYRFGSVGEDGRICLWDFAGGRSLGRTKTTGGPPSGGGTRRPASIHLDPRRGDRDPTCVRESGHSEEQHDPLDVYQPAPSRSAIPTLHPIAAHQLSVGLSGTGAAMPLSPLITIRFSPKGILVLHENGVTVSWDRPKGKRTLVVQQVEEEEREQEERRRRQRGGEQGKATVSKGASSALGAKGAAGLLSKGWGTMRDGLTRTMSSGPQSPQIGGNAALPTPWMQGNLSTGQM